MKIMRDVIERIVAHAETDAPIEACGFLAGVEGRITRDYAMTNAERREDHFTFDPNEQLAAYQTIRLEGLEIVGVYHSHPITPAGPSAEDIRLARNPALIYIIVSLLDQVSPASAQRGNRWRKLCVPGRRTYSCTRMRGLRR
jgi:[CysO sulfur-carrier protein]-S-L-cysteine hydrolase